jgi:hypothetical protein
MLKFLAILSLTCLALTSAFAQQPPMVSSTPDAEQTLKDFPKEPQTTRPASSGTTNFINNSGGDRCYEFYYVNGGQSNWCMHNGENRAFNSRTGDTFACEAGNNGVRNCGRFYMNYGNEYRCLCR